MRSSRGSCICPARRQICQDLRRKGWVIPWEALRESAHCPVTTEAARPRLSDVWRATRRKPTRELSLNSTPAYLSGFADGEGCFCVTFNKSGRHRFGWDIRPSFSASQNHDRAEVLALMKQYFGCGFIRPDRSDKTLKFEIRSVRELTEKVIPHFEKFPSLSSKRRDFQIFAEICRRMLRKEHLTTSGFREISKLAERLNAGGKKRYLRSGFKV